MSKTPVKNHIRYILFMIGGSLIYVAGYCMFIHPNDLLAGGVYGISAVLHYFTPIPIAAYLVILNVPLLLWAWKQLNLRFSIYTVFVIALQSIALFVLQPFFPTYIANPLLACIFGGVLAGLGAGIIVRYHGSGGGLDIIGIILNQRTDISIGTIFLIGNIIIVGLAAFIFGFEKAMYTMVSLYITSHVFNSVLEGFNSKRNVMIISTEGQAIADRLLVDLGRGVTMLEGEGGYSHTRKDVLFCVVSRFELSSLKDIIKGIDEHAFVCINETYEVMGLFPRRGKSNLPRKS
ncbi:MAG: YitT family protein [Bacillota bacterium]|jgi:uncharacterized membrane-anchored protein YitT (DUF2179 family)